MLKSRLLAIGQAWDVEVLFSKEMPRLRGPRGGQSPPKEGLSVDVVQVGLQLLVLWMCLLKVEGRD